VNLLIVFIFCVVYFVYGFLFVFDLLLGDRAGINILKNLVPDEHIECDLFELIWVFGRKIKPSKNSPG